MAVRSVPVTSGSTGAAPPPASPRKPAKPAKPAQRRSRAKQKPAIIGDAEVTPIRVHCNVGLGNRITVRGDTAPIHWDAGVDAQNSAADVWELQLTKVPAGTSFEVKPLINDTAYSTGDNFVGTGGQPVDIYPVF